MPPFPPSSNHPRPHADGAIQAARVRNAPEEALAEVEVAMLRAVEELDRERLLQDSGR